MRQSKPRLQRLLEAPSSALCLLAATTQLWQELEDVALDSTESPNISPFQVVTSCSGFYSFSSFIPLPYLCVPNQGCDILVPQSLHIHLRFILRHRAGL